MNRSPRGRRLDRLRRWGRRAALHARRDDGGSTAIEFIIVAPIVLLVLFTAIEIAQISYARSAALAAAQQGANAERAYNAPAGAGQDKAQTFLDRHAPDLTGTRIDVQHGAEQVTVTVSGTSPTLIPFFDGFGVRQSATGPIERFVE